jgi:hypothetical protein
MLTYRYPREALVPDYLRSMAGLAVTGLPLPWLADSPVSFTILGGIALAFAGFGVATFARQGTVVMLDGEGLRTAGLNAVDLRWDELDSLELRYFSTRRDKEGGWMQLTLRGGGRRVRLDSHLDGFEDVARRAASAAQRRALELSPTTQANLASLGTPPGGGRRKEAM